MSNRYQKTNNGTVLDLQTGLEWQADAAGRMPWKEAIEYAKTLDLGGKNDWLLPTVQELASLIDYGSSPATAFPGVNKGWYWSSAPDDSYNAWYVYFDSGYVGHDDMDIDNYVRCVRFGPAALQLSDDSKLRAEVARLTAKLGAVREWTERESYQSARYARSSEYAAARQEVRALLAAKEEDKEQKAEAFAAQGRDNSNIPGFLMRADASIVEIHDEPTSSSLPQQWIPPEVPDWDLVGSASLDEINLKTPQIDGCYEGAKVVCPKCGEVFLL